MFCKINNQAKRNNSKWKSLMQNKCSNIEDKNIESGIEKYVSTASKFFSKYPNQIYQELLCFLNKKYKPVAFKIQSLK
ncbi:hypothetical protein MXB_4242 [Myxobolus squamalis]|nr:hypothetical protein MXB_4242 [Myxobolus squamalis]